LTPKILLLQNQFFGGGYALTFRNLMTYICHTAALTSRRFILNIYSTNKQTEYFKHAA